MSLKYQCIDSGEGYYTLDKGVEIPVRLFFNETLYDQSEEGLYNQVRIATTYPGALDVVVTPDAHIGTGVPVGCVIATDGALLMEPVGYDIGCGILCFKSTVEAAKGKDAKLRKKFSEQVMQRIGVGVGQNGASIGKTVLEKIYRQGATALGYKRDDCERDHFDVSGDWTPPFKALEKGQTQLGSLGGGNHFAELQAGDDGNLWGMIHTGSRGFGYHLTHHHMTLARQELKNKGIAHKGIEGSYFLPDSPNYDSYKNAVAAGGNFAIANRLTLFEQIATAFRRVYGAEPELVYEISHNLLQTETLPDGRQAVVHRKGATRAFPAGHAALANTKWATTGHPVLVPGSMGDTSYVLFPKANAERSLYSINHGCGRRWSRGEAKQRLTQSAVNKKMRELDVLVNGGGGDVPIDESPEVYKKSDDVIAAVVGAGLAEVAVRLTPLATIKGAE